MMDYFLRYKIYVNMKKFKWDFSIYVFYFLASQELNYTVIYKIIYKII